MTQSREIINGEIIRCHSHGWHSVVAPLERLDRSLGDVVLSERTEGYLRFLVDDGVGLDVDGLAALIRDRDHARDERLHELLDEAGLPRVNPETGLRLSVVGRLTDLARERSTAA